MSTSYKNRRKTIRDLRKSYQAETTDTLKFWSAEFNDNWCGKAAALVLRDRGETS